MVFSSTLFLFLFLPLVLLGYILSPKALRNVCLLVASLLFYAWGEPYLVGVMVATILVNFTSGLFIGDGLKRGPITPLPIDGPRTRQQKFFLGITIGVNLFLLGVFKYFNFGLHSAYALLSALGIEVSQESLALEIALPLGISFFTFQAMSYTFDVYRGHVPATRNIINFATYISLFPQLVAGPIVRYQQIADELLERSVTIEKMSMGIRRFTIGLGKKVIVANIVARPVDLIFALPESEVSTSLAWFAIVCYTLQIYYDFSGYSDMAIGLGLMFGFHFPENFNYPYISKSIREFWRRWHISLSSWFRDYLYIPLGGNQGGNARTYFNLIIVFFLCGLWHGASWAFVLWGLYNGLFLVLERTPFRNLLERLWQPLQHGYTLGVIVFGWLIFRAESTTQLWSFFQAMLGFSTLDSTGRTIQHYWDNQIALVLIFACWGCMPWLSFLKKKYRLNPSDSSSPSKLREVLYESAAFCFTGAVFIYSAMLLSAQSYNPFIYFRF